MFLKFLIKPDNKNLNIVEIIYLDEISVGHMFRFRKFKESSRFLGTILFGFLFFLLSTTSVLAHTLPEVYLGALFGIEYPPYSRIDNLILIINGILHFNDYIFLIALSLFTLAYLILIKNSRLKGSGSAKLSFLLLFIFVIFYFIGFIVKKSIAATVTYPVGGEVFIAGQAITITWSLDAANHIELSYTTSGADCGTNDGGFCSVPPGYSCINHPVGGTSYAWTVPDVSTTTARIRVEGHTSTHDASGPASCSGNFTITKRPAYTSESTSVANNSKYQPGRNYGFQINWTDDFGIDKVFFEANLNSSLTNFTVECSGLETNRLCIINFTDLKAGNYQYRWIANDTNNTFNYTGFITYSIAKNNTPIRLFINDTEADKSYFINQIANFTALFDVPGKTIYLTTNITGFGIISNTSVIYNITNLTTLGTFNVTAWFDGDENYTASSKTWFITVTEAPDTQAPQFSLNSTNSTLAGKPIEFRLKWTDNVGLSHYIFSFDNGTGTFINDTAIPFSGTENWSNVTKVINSTVGSLIRWKVYANDTSNNWNVSDTYSFIANALSIIFVPPTDNNNANVSRNWTYINATIDATNGVNTCMLDWNGTIEVMSKFVSGSSVFCSINKTASEGKYSYRVFANDTLGNFEYSEIRTIKLDLTPPKAVKNLTSIAKGTDFITWNWTNPDDEDFRYVIVYKNGVFLANVTSPPYNFTGLSPNTAYEIATLTVDFAGNINTTWVNASDTTLASGGGGGGGPSIIITSPSSGVNWLAGSTQTISWTSLGVNHFEITYTTDPNAPCQGEPIGTFGGPCSTGSWICIQSHPYTSTSYAWVVPNINSNSVRIRIEGHDSNHMVVTNACSGIFTISNQTTGGPTGGGTTGGAPSGGGTASAVINQTITNQTTANQTTKIQTTVTEIKGIIYVGVDLIEPEKAKTISIGKYNIKDISIKVKNKVTNVEIKVQPLGTKPSGIPEVKGVAYTYINISSANLKKEDLENLAIRFSVNKSWINENDINVSTIKMLHYKNNSWEQLPTKLVGDDNLTAIFESYIKEFSLFAIVGERITKVTPVVEKEVTKLRKYDFIILLVSVVAISIAIAIVLIYRRKQFL